MAIELGARPADPRAGMQLQEILSHPDPASDQDAHARALAGQLGITVRQALHTLHQRMLDRRHS
ncbi:hypothetical protein [Nocardia pseudovaccinii]|uniref:hypothetical protein n=1 Tax=Nocardia pseudovaccinii TaxID=189540 RepID=UPI0012F4A3CE|nr:hypothetical protein [Nocardia pseudovaccinii]